MSFKEDLQVELVNRIGSVDRKAPDVNVQDPKTASCDADESCHEDNQIEITTTDFFAPFPPHPALPEENNPLTVRAVLVGWILGGLVCATSVYFGLKVGMMLDADLFSAIMGFAFLKLFDRLHRIPGLRGRFGPKEHNIIQTVATATGGLAAVYTSFIPAMYRVGALTGDPRKGYWKMVALCAFPAFLGIALSVPYRTWFVVGLARELGLVYPGAVAVAESIRTLHAGPTHPANRKRFKMFCGFFLFALLFSVLSQYAPGIIWAWYPFWWFYVWGGHNNSAIHVVNWGLFVVEWTPMLIGSGMLVDINIGASLLCGNIAGYGIIGPILVAKGIAHGKSASDQYPLVNYKSSMVKDPVNAPSPRSWLLWPSIFMAVAASLTDLVCHGSVFIKSFGIASAYFKAFVHRMRSQWTGKSVSTRSEQQSSEESFSAKLPFPRAWQWTSLAVISTALACLVMGLHFHVNVGIAILALFLAFVFFVINIITLGQSSNSFNVVPTDLIQVIVGSIQRPRAGKTGDKLLQNLAAAGGAMAAGLQIVTMMNDFKLGFLLGTPVRKQWYGQLLGCLLAIFLCPLFFVLYAKAYPCINSASEDGNCAFALPGVLAHAAVASAIISNDFTAKSSWIFAIIAACVASAMHVLRFYLRSTGRTRLEACVPNMLMVAAGTLMARFEFGLAFLLGSVVATVWRKRWQKSHNMFMIPVAAGLMAGEGIAGMVDVVFELAKIAGPEFYGTTLGCPGGSC